MPSLKIFHYIVNNALNPFTTRSNLYVFIQKFRTKSLDEHLHLNFFIFISEAAFWQFHNKILSFLNCMYMMWKFNPISSAFVSLSLSLINWSLFFLTINNNWTCYMRWKIAQLRIRAKKFRNTMLDFFPPLYKLIQI